MSGENFSIPLSQVVKEFNLEVVYQSKDYEDVKITTSEVNRPGMQIVGFFDYFGEARIQILGMVEISYLRTLSSEERKISFERLLDTKIPVITVTRSLEVFDELYKAAEKMDVTIVRTSQSSSNHSSPSEVYAPISACMDRTFMEL